MPEHRVYLTCEETGNEIDLAGPQPFSWVFKTGGSSPAIAYRLLSHVDEQLKAEPWETSTFSLTFDSGANPPRTISGIHVTGRPGNAGVDGGQWVLEDLRTSLTGCTVDTMFNDIRAQNSRVRPGTPTDPNIALFAQVPLNSFILHTLQDAGSPDQPRPASGSNDNVKPWTALEALKYLVTNDGWLRDYNTGPDGAPKGFPLLGRDGNIFQFGELIVSDLVTDNKYILKKWNPRSNWAEAVNDLARKARVLVYVGPDRQIIIQSGDPKYSNGLIRKYGKYAGSGGIPTLATLRSQAPRDLNFRFPMFQEIRFDFDETWFVNAYGQFGPGVTPIQSVIRPLGNNDIINREAWDKAPNRRTFMLENVLRLPQDTLNYQKGTWVPIPVALNEWASDKANLPRPRGLTPEEVFSYPTILRYILTTGLANIYMRDAQRIGFRNPILEARVASVYQSFRRHYRIPEVWLDHIESWKPVTASIFSSSARARQPSPVYMDSYAWDSYLNYVPRSDGTRPDEIGQGMIRNYPLRGNIEIDAIRNNIPPRNGSQVRATYTTDFFLRSYEIPLADMIPSMFSISVIDSKQGVFEVVAPPDLSGQTEAHSPGLFDPGSTPTRDVTKIRAAGLKIMGDLAMLGGHRMVTVFSVKWRSPNSIDRHHEFRFEGNDFLPGASGPHMDMFYPAFPAFRVWEDGRVRWDNNSNGRLRIDHQGRLENEDMLKEVAVGEVNELYFQYQPRIIGVYRASPGNGVLPIGHIGTTRVQLQQGVYESEVQATGQPRGASAWRFFSPYTKDVLSRLESGSNDLLEP